MDAYRGSYEAVTKAEDDAKQSQVYLETVAIGAQLATTDGAIRARLLDGVEAYGSPILDPEVASVVAITRRCVTARTPLRSAAEGATPARP